MNALDQLTSAENLARYARIFARPGANRDEIAEAFALPPAVVEELFGERPAPLMYPNTTRRPSTGRARYYEAGLQRIGDTNLYCVWDAAVWLRYVLLVHGVSADTPWPEAIEAARCLAILGTDAEKP